MHQTFYIDIDEEITSVVEKIKNAQYKEVIIVVPKGALLIQSIINLMVLKKEADDLNLQLMIVTQDKLGKFLVEKAGILVQQKMDNIEDEKEMIEEKNFYNQEKFENQEKNGVEINQDKTKNIGSENFFSPSKKKAEEFPQYPFSQRAKEKEMEIKKERIVNKELVLGSPADSIKSKNGFLSDNQKFSPVRPNFGRTLSEIEKNKAFEESEKKDEFPRESNIFNQDEKIKNFFYPSNSSEKFVKKQNYSQSDYGVSSKFKKIFLSFLFLGILAGGGALAYLFIPKSSIILTPKIKNRAVDSEIMGDINSSSADFEKKVIPAETVEMVNEISKTFNATGEKSVSNQKASGTIKIFNEYGTEEQSLVATTRFLSEDGKLFRLSEGVTVPGAKKEGDNFVPGEIEARVVADKPGEEFNIGPAKFTIPGFQDSGLEKYTKFYAKSESTMTGGGKEEKKSNSVTEEDIQKAKAQLLNELNQSAVEKIKEKAGAEKIVLEDAINKEEAVYKISNSPGDVAESFQMTVQMKVSALVFSDKEIKKMVSSMIAERESESVNVDEDFISLDFGKADPNFRTGLINIKFHAKANLIPDINIEEIKSNILGKDEDYLKNYLDNFPDIDGASIEYWPSFLKGRIPFQAKRVEIRLDN